MEMIFGYSVVALLAVIVLELDKIRVSKQKVLVLPAPKLAAVKTEPIPQPAQTQRYARMTPQEFAVYAEKENDRLVAEMQKQMEVSKK